MVDDLIDKTLILKDNKKLRLEMGKNGRNKIEFGKFSLIKKNQKLKKIFDEST